MTEEKDKKNKKLIEGKDILQDCFDWSYDYFKVNGKNIEELPVSCYEYTILMLEMAGHIHKFNPQHMAQFKQDIYDNNVKYCLWDGSLIPFKIFEKSREPILKVQPITIGALE